MKKASKMVLGGLAVIASAGAQAGVTPPVYDLLENCEAGDFGVITVEENDACFEVAWRCDGDTGAYGVCLFGDFGGDGDEMGGEWSAYENDEFATCASGYGFGDGYGVFLGASGGATSLEKWQSKVTDATPGNGKSGHPGNKAGDTGTTVEVSMKRVECPEF